MTPGGVAAHDVSPKRWPVAIGVVAVCTLVFACAFAPTLVSLASLWWHNSDYGHGILVVPISAYLIWCKRSYLSTIQPRPCLWGAVLVLALSVVWFVALILGVQLVQQVAVIVMLAAMVLTVFGKASARALAFPILYVVLVIPIWSLLVPVLQDSTAVMSTELLRMLGVPVFLEGHYLSIPSGRFVVAEVCAGLRYLLATMAIAALYAHLNFTSVVRAAVFFIVCVLLAVVYNWVRVVIIVFIGHVSEMQHPLVEQHLMLGWILFAVTLVPLFLLGAWLGRGRAQDTSGHIVEKQNSRISTGVFVVAGVTAMAGMVIGPVLGASMRSDASVARANVQLEPLRISKWTAERGAEIDWAPRFVGVDAQNLSYYTRGEAGPIAVYLGFYQRQRQGAEVVNQANKLFDKKLWRRSSVVSGELRVAPPMPIKEHHLFGRNDERKRLMVVTYFTGGRETGSELEAKWAQLRSLFGAEVGAGVMAIAMDVTGDWQEARARLWQFAEAAAPLARRRWLQLGDAVNEP